MYRIVLNLVGLVCLIVALVGECGCARQQPDRIPGDPNNPDDKGATEVLPDGCKVRAGPEQIKAMPYDATSWSLYAVPYIGQNPPHYLGDGLEVRLDNHIALEVWMEINRHWSGWLWLNSQEYKEDYEEEQPTAPLPKPYAVQVVPSYHYNPLPKNQQERLDEILKELNKLGSQRKDTELDRIKQDFADIKKALELLEKRVEELHAK